MFERDNSKQRSIVKSNKKLILISLLILICASSVLADMFRPSDYCSKPIKPYEFTDQWEVDSFNDAVESYRSCIQDFVEEQNDAARNHQEASQDAIDEWNNFVNYELN